MDVEQVCANAQDILRSSQGAGAITRTRHFHQTLSESPALAIFNVPRNIAGFSKEAFSIRLLGCG